MRLEKVLWKREEVHKCLGERKNKLREVLN